MTGTDAAASYQTLRGHLAYLKLTRAEELLAAHLEAARAQQLSHVAFLVFRDGQVGDGGGVAASDLSRVSGRVGRAHGRDRAWTWWCPRPGSWPWAPGSGRGGGVG
jgi:hypothetical protein